MRSWKFYDLLRPFLHKYKTDIHTKDATRSVWKCNQFSPTPTRFAARAQGTARLDDGQHLGKPRRCNAPLRDAPRSSHAHITRPHRVVDRSETYRHRPDRRTLV